MKLRFTPFLVVLGFLRCGGPSEPARPGTEPDADVDASVEEDGNTAVTCPKTGTPKVVGTIAPPEVDEASGIVASALNQGVYWVHNDSGDVARAFAVTQAGTRRALLSFDDVKPDDIEDMAIEDDTSGKSYLYFGDIGDNGLARKSLTIHRVAEPKLAAGDATLTATSEKMTVTYVDGPHNAETLLFDPIEKDLIIVTKVPGGPSDIHRIGKFGAKATTTKIGSVDIDLATGGDISRDGRFIAIRNYTTTGLLWQRAEGESVADAMARPPCKIPIASEPQGETLGFLVDGTGYVTVSEGASQDLHLTLFK